MPDDSTPPYQRSSYPELKLPEGGWKSQIPDHLLADADPATVWIMQELSKNTQATDWLTHGLLDTNRQTRATNGRLLKAEADIKEDKEGLKALTTKADLMEPLFKPLSLLMRMWEYKVFRWATYLLIFFFFTYLLPYYISHPISLQNLWTLLFGA